MAENANLPELPAWQARSFWITLIGAALQIAALMKFDLLGFLHVENSEALTDAVMQIVGAVALVWAWFERKAPNYRLSLSGKSGLQSPWFVAIAAIGIALLLSGCAGITERTGLSAEQQQCVALQAVSAAQASRADFADLSYTQRAAFVATTAEGIADACAVDLGVYRTYLDTAIIAAALAE